MVADVGRERRRLALHHVLLHDVVAVRRLGDLDPELVAPLAHQAVDARVADARIRVLHHLVGAGDVGAGVLLVVGQQRQVVQVHLVAGEDDLLDRRVLARDHHGLDRVVLAAAVLAGELRHRRARRQADRHRQALEGGVDVRDDGDLRAADVAEDDDRIAPLALELREQRGDLELRIDLAIDVEDLVRVVVLQVAEEAAQVAAGGQRPGRPLGDRRTPAGQDREVHPVGAVPPRGASRVGFAP